ncbi:MAG: polyphenol oxidase family protein [Coriobacteriia bacterium]|nr:polyphenol oxidase family protein [Coriobacteriia bacterium]MCL2750317.1 polyphenol oxidase family protein [Coriobacteriia bacterium]
MNGFLVEKAAFSVAPSHRFIAFTTLSECKDGSRASFAEGIEEQARRELEVALMPLGVTWLSLQHGADVILISDKQSPVSVDAAIVDTPGFAVAFTTADCLPVVLVSESCGLIAGIHAGWRGVARGVIENCCAELATLNDGQMPLDTLAWIGPAIKAADYEVDATTREELLASASVSGEHFSPTKPGHFCADLPAMALAKLKAAGVAAERISVQPQSTFTETKYHSARRDGVTSGRMATVVGILEQGDGVSVPI